MHIYIYISVHTAIFTYTHSRKKLCGGEGAHVSDTNKKKQQTHKIVHKKREPRAAASMRATTIHSSKKGTSESAVSQPLGALEQFQASVCAKQNHVR